MAEQDVVKLWIEERCILAEASASGGELRTKMQALYEDYRNWRTARGEHSEAIQRWSQVMQSNGFKQLTIRGARHFAHIGLKSDRDDF